ncbi:MAG TPA: nicotinate phosphoribosyltransferase [Chloroflexota bacterium]
MAEPPPPRRFPLLPEAVSGDTADVYFLRTREALSHLGRDPVVGMEVFSRKPAIFCGVSQVVQLLLEAGFTGEVWAMDEGAPLKPNEASLEIVARYSAFGIYETAILGILSSCTGWATTAREVVEAASGVPVVSFGARHIHPNVAGIMDYSAIVGGCVGCSTPLGAVLTGTSASGTMPHAFILIVGDTVEAARVFDRSMPEDVPRIVLVDTLQDEAVESLRVAEALGSALEGVRLDTPSERGGVTPDLVTEVRARLELAGYTQVHIVISGGLTPDRIRAFRETGAPVDSYGVGSYISGAAAVDFTADIKEIEGRPVAKRGRIPGLQRNERLKRIV